jgi:hypothetical protein
MPYYYQFDPERRQRRLERLRRIPVRKLVPNVITLLALCAGLTGIKLAIENRYERSARSCSPPCSTRSTAASRA